jgi:hypothetical protein
MIITPIKKLHNGIEKTHVKSTFITKKKLKKFEVDRMKKYANSHMVKTVSNFPHHKYEFSKQHFRCFPD